MHKLSLYFALTYKYDLFLKERELKEIEVVPMATTLKLHFMKQEIKIPTYGNFEKGQARFESKMLYSLPSYKKPREQTLDHNASDFPILMQVCFSNRQ